MEINKFTKQDFGTLTTLTNPKTGVVMFLASEIGKMWGHTNITQAISRILNPEEYMIVKKGKYPSFFKILTLNQMLTAKAQHIQLITESAIYKLALASNLQKAKPFKDWVTGEVIPSIRKHGYYSIADQQNAVLIHTNNSTQKQNSKDINAKHYIEQGVEAIIEYNRQSCLLHTGKTTKQIKEIGKQKGLKSIERNSAKQVLRNIKPELACAMSFTDSLVKQGFDLKTVSELSLKSAVPLFQGMIELGANPAELNS